MSDKHRYSLPLNCRSLARIVFNICRSQKRMTWISAHGLLFYRLSLGSGLCQKTYWCDLGVTNTPHAYITAFLFPRKLQYQIACTPLQLYLRPVSPLLTSTLQCLLFSYTGWLVRYRQSSASTSHLWQRDRATLSVHHLRLASSVIRQW